jgi:hypothetical protein
MDSAAGARRELRAGSAAARQRRHVALDVDKAAAKNDNQRRQAELAGGVSGEQQAGTRA